MLTVLHMSGSPQQRPANSMSLIDRIKSHAAHVANLTYGPSGDGHRFTVVPTTPPLTEQRGVYFLLSHSDTQIQKVGLANGKGGLRQRMRGYECLYLGNAEDTDPTVALWQRIMTGPLQGQTLSLWFISLSAFTTVEVLGNSLTVSCDPHPEVERILAREAEACGQPLLMSSRQACGDGTAAGGGNGGPLPAVPSQPQQPLPPFEPGSFAEYFYTRFPSDLRRIKKQEPNPIVRDEIMRDPSAVFFGGLDWESVKADLAKVPIENRGRFVLSLFMVTLTEQVIYTYFRNHYDMWRAGTGFPKFGWSGYGPHHENPFILLWAPEREGVLQPNVVLPLLPEFVRFYLEATASYFRQHLPAIQMSDFLWGLVSDPGYQFTVGTISPAFRTLFDEAVASLVRRRR